MANMYRQSPCKISSKSAKQFWRHSNVSISKMAAIRYLEFFDISNFWQPARLGGPICLTVPNFIKIGQAVAEKSCLMVFKMVTIRHLGFFKFDYLNCCYGP